MDRTAFEAELNRYTQEELRLIYATQQDVYSGEELEMIAARLEPVPEPEKTSPLTVICWILSCIVPFFGAGRRMNAAESSAAICWSAAVCRRSASVS